MVPEPLKRNPIALNHPGMQSVDMKVKGRKLRKRDIEGKLRRRREMENEERKSGRGLTKWKRPGRGRNFT